ncbi:hypothetical protein K501DRAFT_256068 [Backusella circina FSU 941]|nr:hypothetical protein K501DRAFT_256068 [Backusella circina FSU 941]
MATERSTWNKHLSDFFKNIGLVETSECLDSEIILLSQKNVDKLPKQLETLVEHLLESLECHVTAKERILFNPNQDTSGLLVKKRKRSPETQEEKQEEKQEEIKERVKKLDGEQVQIRATNDEVEQRVQTFIQAKQNELDESNRTEFLSRHDPNADDITCARTDAREINRNIQMKFDIVNNEDSSLARSLLPSRLNETNTSTTIQGGADMTERVNNIQDHLHVKFDVTAKPSFSMFERIKILENTLIEMERQYPTWAAVHFNQPNRSFPPPPPVHYITRPSTESNSDSNNSYISTQITTTAPQHQPSSKQTGKAASSLTRAVIEQMNRQVEVSRQTVESSISEK